MRLRLALSEALLGLRRNTLMTIAALLTVSISLALLGAALVMRSEISQMQAYYYTKIQVSVFLTPDVTAEQRDAIHDAIASLPVVAPDGITYESKEEAFRRAKIEFKDVPNVLLNVTADDLPESYRVKLKDPTQFETVRSALDGMPGVDEVQDQKALLDRLFGVLTGLRNAALALAAVQLLAATLLISNTVRLTAHARRQETGVMRLVGASRLQIQLPFLLEGVMAGAGGAVIGVVLLALGKGLVLDRKLSPLFGSGILPKVHWSLVLGQLPVLVILGVLISGIASLLAVRRYVRL